MKEMLRVESPSEGIRRYEERVDMDEHYKEMRKTMVKSDRKWWLCSECSFSAQRTDTTYWCANPEASFFTEVVHGDSPWQAARWCGMWKERT